MEVWRSARSSPEGSLTLKYERGGLSWLWLEHTGSLTNKVTLICMVMDTIVLVSPDSEPAFGSFTAQEHSLQRPAWRRIWN